MLDLGWTVRSLSPPIREIYWFLLMGPLQGCSWMFLSGKHPWSEQLTGGKGWMRGQLQLIRTHASSVFQLTHFLTAQLSCIIQRQKQPIDRLFKCLKWCKMIHSNKACLISTCRHHPMNLSSTCYNSPGCIVLTHLHQTDKPKAEFRHLAE